MNKRKLIKTMQAEFDAGETLQKIYIKYNDSGISEKNLAALVGRLKDKNLIKKHKLAKNALIALMVLITFFTAVSGYNIGLNGGYNNPIYWSFIAVIPAIFLYGFIKVNYQIYMAYLILSLTQFPKSFKNFGDDLIIDVIGIAFAIFLIAFVWYLKNKLFPYMLLFGARRNSNKQYVFSK